ncbi:MAG: P-type conjugative transfer protein TrbL [Acidiferrobacteraceae bacterium]
MRASPLRKSSRAWTGALAALLLPVTAHAAPPGILDSIQQSYRSATSTWMASALADARPLFGGLAVLEIAWAGGQYLLRRNDLPEFIGSVFLKVVSIAFFYTFLVEAPTWIPDIIHSFSQAGQTIGGAGVGPALTPSGIFNLGVEVARSLLDAISGTAPGITQTLTSGGLALGSFLLGALVIALSALLALCGFAIVAVQLLVTLIESYIVIGGGALMLGFAGSRWTLPFAEKYLGYAVSVGIKLFVLYLIVGLGGTIAQQLTAQIVSYGPNVPPIVYLQAGVGSLVFGAIGYLVPGLAGAMMNGSPQMSLGTLGGAAAGFAGGAALTGVAGLRGAAALANTTIGAAKGVGAVGTAARGLGGRTALGLGLTAAGSQAGDALLGVGGRRATQIAGALGDQAVQGWGAETVGGRFANRVRARTLNGSHSAPASAGTEGGTPPAGTPNSLGGGAQLGSTSPGPTGAGPARSGGNGTAALRQLANTHLPQDGPAGGISIRLNHTE